MHRWRTRRRPWRGPPARDVLMPGAAPRTWSKSAFAALRAHTIVGIDRCPGAGPRARRARSPWPGRSPRVARTATQAARHSGDGERRRHRRRRARLGSAERLALMTARAHCADASSREADPPRRADRAAGRADGRHGRARVRCRRARSCRRPPKARKRWPASLSSTSAAQNPSPICSAAGHRSRCGWRNGRACSPPTATRAAVAALKQAAGATSGLKPVEAEVARPVPASGARPMELKGMDAVVFDPPRQGAEAQARELAKSAVKRAAGRRCRAIRQPSHATRGFSIDGGYQADRMSRRSTSSVTRRMWRSSPASSAKWAR
jgi:hypothetical protein